MCGWSGGGEAGGFLRPVTRAAGDFAPRASLGQGRCRIRLSIGQLRTACGQDLATFVEDPSYEDVKGACEKEGDAHRVVKCRYARASPATQIR